MIAEVRLWGRTVGAVSQEPGDPYAVFEYDPAFARSDIEISPIAMPLRAGTYSFPRLNPQSFHGLPGLLADSLPDRFGNALIDAWLAREGRSAQSVTPVDRLCFVGTRGMGALEYHPVEGPKFPQGAAIQVEALVRVASEVLTRRSGISGSFGKHGRHDTLLDLIHVGTSAGGARAKAVVAWNRTTDEVRSGQVEPGSGFEHWIIKFDGVSNNRDHDLADPQGFGVIEYAYSLMAKRAGIEMAECRLMEEGVRRHFMTRRFDRPAAGGRLHIQSLGALSHFDYNQPGAHAYEQALLVISQLELPRKALLEQLRRMLFNVVARNQDDHVKNIAFLMDKQGIWALSPAYDVIYSYNPMGDWTSRHQMTINGKQDDFSMADFEKCAAVVRISRTTVAGILVEVIDAVKVWAEIAAGVGVPQDVSDEIARNHRLTFEGK